MSGRRVLVLAMLLSIPSVAFAQRSRAASGRDKNLMAEDGRDSRPQLTARELEEQSPIRLLVDKRKDLKLSDEQVGKLKDIESRLKEKNGSLLRIVDSVNREMKPPRGGEVTDEYRTKIGNLREELLGAIKDERTSKDASTKEALPLLDEEQQKKANELLEKQAADVAKTMRDKLGGRGGRP